MDRVRVLEGCINDRSPACEDVDRDIQFDTLFVKRVDAAVVDGVVVVGRLESKRHETVLSDESFRLRERILWVSQRINCHHPTEPSGVFGNLVRHILVGDVDVVVVRMIRMRSGAANVPSLHDPDVYPGIIE